MKKVICRPCKEKNDWEICMPNGQVNEKHYSSKQECVKNGEIIAEEYSCDLIVEDDFDY